MMSHVTSTFFVPVFGGRLDVDEYAISNDNIGMVFRRLSLSPALFSYDYLKKFERRGSTLYLLQNMKPSNIEVEITSNIPLDDALFLARNYIHLVSIRANCVLGTPHYCSHSLRDLKALDAVPDKTITFQVCTDADVMLQRESLDVIDASAIEWAFTQFPNFAVLANHRRFVVAYQAYLSERLAYDPRMSLLTVWSALETLFAIDREQTFRLSLLVAYLLERTSAQRKELFDQMRKAYNVRSAVTHGRDLSDADLISSVIWATSVLRRCLARILETRAMPDSDHLLFPAETSVTQGPIT